VKSKQELIALLESHGDLIQIETGDWVYWPFHANRGYLDVDALRVIADELERRNVNDIVDGTQR
jgi:hypothetical protein